MHDGVTALVLEGKHSLWLVGCGSLSASLCCCHTLLSPCHCQKPHGNIAVCDVAGFSDYSLLETAIRSSHAMRCDVWKRHLLAPATRHTNTKYQGRRQQETHTPTAKTVYRNHDRSPTARHRIRNEKREREIRESSTIHHPTSCQLFPEPIRQFRSIPIYPTVVLARGLIGTCVGPKALQSSQLLPP